MMPRRNIRWKEETACEGFQKKQPRSPQKRLYFVDNPNKEELSMLDTKSSSRSSGNNSDGVSEAEIAEVQVSGEQ